MKIHFESDEELALLAARLGHTEGVSDSELAASFQAWFDNKPHPKGHRRLRPDDLDGLRAVADYAEWDERGPGNSDAATGWLGAG